MKSEIQFLFKVNSTKLNERYDHLTKEEDTHQAIQVFAHTHWQHIYQACRVAEELLLLHVALRKYITIAIIVVWCIKTCKIQNSLIDHKNDKTKGT